MRTTISINDRLLRQAKRLSAERGCSLGELVDEALGLAFAQGAAAASDDPSGPLKTFRGGGTLPGVDLLDSADLLRVMEADSRA